MLRILLTPIILAMCWNIQAADKMTTFALTLQQDDVVVFLGSEFVEQDTKYNYLETALTLANPQVNFTYRNLGWAGDDPSGRARGYFGGASEGYQRLQEELTRLKPTVIMVYYGTIGQRMTEEEKSKVARDYDKLLVDLKKLTSRIIVFSPLPRELPQDLQSTNREIQDYHQTFILPLLLKYQVTHVDLGKLVKPMLDQAKEPLTSDSLRFQDVGYRLITNKILETTNIKQPENWDSYAELRQLIQEKNDLYFHRYRPQNETYLRGFRKHEQGQNAVEIQQFDKLITQAEARIRAQVKGEKLPPPVDEPPAREQTFVALTPAEQLKQFSLAPGLKAELFAAEPMVKNPIAMNFDGQGRLWVACSPIYPQLRPGAKPSDKVVILEDTNGDGLADKSTDFADDLLIPTGVLPDEKGGAYVGNSTELLHLEDTNGDGKADKRTVVLAGFGTEDTHHILHTFTWGPDGAMYFNQSIYIHTYAETKHGVKKLLAGGTWRYIPETHHLEVFSRGLVNSWGHAFDRWGQSFMTDGAGGQGINYAFPGAAFVTADNAPRILNGLNPGQPKLCGLEIISGSHFSEKWQNKFITADFRGNRISSFELTPQGSGYISRQSDEVISCKDRAFRPVDIKLGYDGCLYLADWHNPIINHGEVDFRDPRRDDRHGRIWRIVEEGKEKAKRPDFATSNVNELFNLMHDSSLNVRKLSRRLLDSKSQEEVHQEVQARLSRNMNLLNEQKVSPNDISDSNWKYAGIMLKNPEVLQFSTRLKQNIKSDLRVMNDQAETASLRGLRDSLAAYENVTGDTSITRNFNPDAIYLRKLADYHPQYILESLHLLRIIKRYQTVDFALATLDQPLDDFLDYALWLTIRETQPQWLPELNSGKLEFVNDPKKVMYVLKATENPALITPLVKLLQEKKVATDQVVPVLELIGKYGQKEHLQLLWDQALAETDNRSAIIKILYDTAKVRKIKPDNFTQRIAELATVPHALPLAGLWKVNAVKPVAMKLALDQQTPESDRIQAIMALETFQDRETLVVIASNNATPPGFKRIALTSLINLDPPGGIKLAAAFLAEIKSEQKAEFNSLLDVILSKQQGPQILSDALKNVTLNSELVTEAIRKTSSIGKRGEALIVALRKSGSIIQGITKLTPEQTQALVKKVAEVGSAERGETIYRRKELNCQKCHPLAGAGGQVGPDMLSLGASSPVDYIIQSLIEPSAKIKEGYHTTQLRTLDGVALLGLLVRETNDEVVIRNAENKEVSIPKGDIEEKKNSTTSLMPAELTAKLSEDEFIDLVTFLANLGKDGPYKAPAKRYVRRWILEDKSEIYSQINGMLPMSEAAEHTVTIEIKVTAPGKIGLKLSDLQFKRATRGTETDNLKAETIVADLPVGIHQFHFGIPKRTEPFSIEVLDLPDSAGVAEPVNK